MSLSEPELLLLKIYLKMQLLLVFPQKSYQRKPQHDILAIVITT